MKPLPLEETMKRKHFVMICLAIIAVLSICFFVYKSVQNKILLCDYGDIAIDISECHLTKDELDTAISVQLSALNTETTELTDEIARLYFQKDTAEQAKESIIYEIVKNRYYESLYFQILELSYVDEKLLNEYAEQTYEQLILLANEKGLYLSQYLEIDVFDNEVFMETLRNMKKERLILDKIIQKENIAVPTENEISSMYEFYNELNTLERDYLNYTIKYAVVEEHLLTIRRSEIETYFDIIKSDL